MDKVLDSALLSSANKRKGILAIGAHPDDIELGCGASLARLAQKGIYIAAVVMTTGNSGTDGIIDRHEESRNALKILGCHQTIHLNFADTRETNVVLKPGMTFTIEPMVNAGKKEIR
ncbi:PIG-L family deacetylase, partial [Escherichia coli]